MVDATGGPHCVYCGYEGQRMVVDGPLLSWEKGIADSADLGTCPNNGGVRIFPDKVSPTDPTPALRQRVTLAATIDPPVGGVTVYFKVFDVDDPFDQSHPTMADVSLIDADASGPDNRPLPGEIPWTDSDVTDANGKAQVTFTVSMQPGNNYRAVASRVAAAVAQVAQADADALNTRNPASAGAAVRGCFDPLIWSPMLTVWRKLHVETDSMVRPTFAQNTYPSTWSEPTAPLTGSYVGLPSPPWFEIKVADKEDGSGAGQFNNGFIELNGTTRSRVFDYFSTAGSDEVIVQFPNGLGGLTGGPCVVSDDDLSDEPTIAAKVFGCDGGYAGGTVLSPPDVSALQLRYGPAYIDPLHETSVSGTGGITTFLRNVSFGFFGDYGKALWDRATPPTVRQLPISSADFWTVMVLTSWQAETGKDGDPDAETLTNGISTHDLGATTSSLGPQYTGLCTIFKGLMIGESDIPERFTVAHEIGHTLGLPHSSSGLMFAAESTGAPAQQSEPFSAESLKKLREYSGP